MKARVFLNEIRKLDTMIENKLAEKAHWRSMALNITPQPETVKINGKMHIMDKVQSSGNPHKMEDAIAKCIDLDAEIDRCIDDLIEKKREIISVIERLSATEYDLLHKIYVQNQNLYDVADKYNRTYSWVTTIHGRALKNVQNILDEMEGQRNESIHEETGDAKSG